MDGISVGRLIAYSKKKPLSDNSELKGDVDNVILKSLRKEPEQRYQTVEQFSADIWQYIDGLPILTRRATVSYRARKFYQRNKLPVISGLLVFLALIAGIAVAFWQANAAREQAKLAYDAQHRSEVQTEHASKEETKAKKITAFMSKVVSYANPAWFAKGARFKGDARVIDVLDDLSDKIDIEFEGQPDIQSELHHKFTEVYNFVRQREKNPLQAEKYLLKQKFNALRALELRKHFYGERHELVAKDMFYAAYFYGDINTQAQMLAQAIEMMRETNPKNLNLRYMLEAYGYLLITTEQVDDTKIYLQNALPTTSLGKHELAEKYFAEMLELFHWHFKEENYSIISSNCDLAVVKSKLGKFAEAQNYYQTCRTPKTNLNVEINQKQSEIE